MLLKNSAACFLMSNSEQDVHHPEYVKITFLNMLFTWRKTSPVTDIEFLCRFEAENFTNQTEIQVTHAHRHLSYKYEFWPYRWKPTIYTQYMFQGLSATSQLMVFLSIFYIKILKIISEHNLHFQSLELQVCLKIYKTSCVKLNS